MNLWLVMFVVFTSPFAVKANFDCSNLFEAEAIFDFSWDPIKEISNLKKHKVSFDEGQSVFRDLNALEWPDVYGSYGEDRWFITGASSTGELLTVVYAEWETNYYRIISARKSTSQEKAEYKNYSNKEFIF